MNPNTNDGPGPGLEASQMRLADDSALPSPPNTVPILRSKCL